MGFGSQEEQCYLLQVLGYDFAQCSQDQEVGQICEMELQRLREIEVILLNLSNQTGHQGRSLAHESKTRAQLLEQYCQGACPQGTE